MCGCKHRSLSMKKFICKNCNQAFSDYPSNDRIFCSKDCHSIHMKNTGTFSQNNNPKWNGGLVIKECNVCNKEFRVKPYRKDTAKFCSHKCSEIVRDEGKTPLYKRIRKSKEYIAWREGVFFRDDYQCQLCNKRGGELQADHIKPFALYPELRFAIDNGRALCVDCHKTTDTWGYRSIYRVTSATEA